MSARRICVGVITKPFGTKGQVRLRPYTKSPDFFLQNTKLLLENGNEILLKYPRAEQSGDIITCVDGIQDRTVAEELRLQKVFVLREELRSLDDNEYYFEDLIGLLMIDEKHECLGEVVAVYDYGAGVFLEIKMKNSQVATIPFNKDAVVNVNLHDLKITVNKRFLLV